MRHVIISIILALLSIGLVSSATITSFDDGTSTGQLNFDAGGNHTKTVTLANFGIVTNAYINLSCENCYNSNETPYNITEGINVTTYSGYWPITTGVSNVSYANDGQLETYTHMTAPGSSRDYYLNFTIQNYTKVNVSLLAHFLSGNAYLFAYCENKSNPGSYIDISQGTISSPYALEYYTWEAHEECLGLAPTQLNLKFNYNFAAGEWARMYDTWLNITTGTSPTNVSLWLDNTQVYLNDTTPFNSSAIINFTSYFSNPLTAALHTLTFKANFGTLSFSNLSVSYLTNHSIVFRDEQTGLVYASGSVRVNRILNNVTWDNYTTSTGYVDPANIDIAGIIDLEYYDVNGLFPTRHYYYRNDPGESYNHTLYVVNQTNVTETLLTLYQEAGDIVPNYYIEIYRRDPNENTFNIVEMHKTDFNGQSLLHVVPYDVTYKIGVLDESLNRVYLSNETTIKSDSISLTIQLSDDIWQSLRNIRGLQFGEPTFNAATSQFVMYYEDPSNAVSFVEFITTRRTGLGESLICSNKSTSSSAFLYCSIPDINQTGIWHLEVNINTTSGDYLLVYSSDYQNSDVPDKASKVGLWLTLLLVIALSLMGASNPAEVILFSCLALIIAVLIKMYLLSIGLVAVICITGVIAMVKSKT